MEKSQTVYRPMRIEAYMWVVSSVMALLCFSFGGVISGQVSDFPIHLKLTISLASLTFMVILLIFFSLRFLITEKRLPTVHDSNFSGMENWRQGLSLVT